MAALATTDDVAGRWRPLTSAEEEVAEVLLEDASAILRYRISTLDTRLEDGTLDSALVTAVVARSVVRAMRNPEGVSSKTTSIDDYSETERYDTARDALYISDEDLSLLAPSGSATGAFTITPYGAADTTTPVNWWEIA